MALHGERRVHPRRAKSDRKRPKLSGVGCHASLDVSMLISKPHGNLNRGGCEVISHREG